MICSSENLWISSSAPGEADSTPVRDKLGFQVGWTQERRTRQAAAIKQWKPWERSTGPRTTVGKARAARNAYSGATRALLRELARALRHQKQSLSTAVDPSATERLPDSGRSKAIAQRSSAGKSDDQVLHFPRAIEWQKMPAILDCCRLRARNQASIIVPLSGCRPIVVAPDQQHRHIDVSVYLAGFFPGFGIAQQAQECSVVAGPITNRIHFSQQFDRDGRGIDDATLQDRLNDHKISEARERFAYYRNIW
jgi:hypothetical protein